MQYLVAATIVVLVCHLDQAFAFIDSSGRYVWDPTASLRSVKIPQRFNGLSIQELEIPGISSVDTSVLTVPDMSALQPAIDLLSFDKFKSSLANFDSHYPVMIEDFARFLHNYPLLLAPVFQIALVVAIVAASRANTLSDENKYGKRNISYVERAKSEMYATNGRYNPVDAGIYYGARPLQVIWRSSRIFSSSVSFGLRLAMDLAQKSFSTMTASCNVPRNYVTFSLT